MRGLAFTGTVRTCKSYLTATDRLGFGRENLIEQRDAWLDRQQIQVRTVGPKDHSRATVKKEM